MRKCCGYVIAGRSSDVLLHTAFYFLFKTLFTIWLMLPSTRGAEILWRNAVQPMYRQMVGSINAQTPVTGYATNTTSFERAFIVS